LVVAGILRFSALDRQGLWDDESFTLRALGIMPEPMTMAEGAPPLYFLLLRGWVAIAGTSLAGVRAFSALWGTAGVAIIDLFAGRAMSPQAGFFSATVLSFHPFHLAYSQDARPYAMVFALAKVTIWMAWEERVWLFILASTTLLWTHPWGVSGWCQAEY
jgi:mannosyltransferase